MSMRKTEFTIISDKSVSVILLKIVIENNIIRSILEIIQRYLVDR